MAYDAQDAGPVVLDEAWAPPVTPPPSRGRLALVAGLAVATVIGGAVLTYDEPATPVPSLFGLDAATATDLLDAEGYRVELRPARACEPRGLVLGTEPGIGTVAPPGSLVTVRYAVPADVFCMPAYAGRVDGWEFLHFATGGPAPDFADEVTVSTRTRTDTTTRVLDGEAASDRGSWGTALDPLREAGEEYAPTSSGMPRLSVDVDARLGGTCPAATSPVAANRTPLRLRLESVERPAVQECPLTIDLYRDPDGRIDTVVLAPRSAS